jgi:lantibiotic modifying enzyme
MQERLAEVASRVRSALSQPSVEAGLMTGRAGLLLFLLYYARWSGSPIDRRVADEAFSDLFATLPEDLPPTFCSGTAGIAWLLRHAVAEQLIDADADEPLADVDALLRQRMVEEMSAGRFDYLHGALGMALYFLEAHDRAENKRALTETIHQLERHARSDGAQAHWLNPLTDEDPPTRGLVSLGLSHGVPGIVCVLQRYIDAGIEPGLAERLRDRALAYIRSQELDQTAPSRFPAFAGEGTSRLAWCYGDPGVAMALWQAGQQHSAIATLRHAAARQPGSPGLPDDLSICHGSSGLAVIFDRAHRITGDRVFSDASRRWQDDMQSRLQDTADLSMLTGVAGAGLAMLTLADDADRLSAWDRALLLR